jgi:WD40 repeat protein
MRTHFLALLIALALAESSSAEPAVLANRDVPQPDTIRKLITELGDPSFAVRDAASKRLESLGEPALELLKKAAKDSETLELGRRASLLVERISRRLFGEVRSIEGHPNSWATRIVATQDGKRILSGGSEALRLWDVAAGKLMQIWGPGTAYWSVALSADGKRAIAGANDHVARVFDLNTGQECQKLVGHKGPIWGVALSADGQRAITGGWDKSLRAWEVASGKELAVFPNVAEKVRCLALSADGKTVAVGHFGEGNAPPGTLRLWDVKTGHEIREFRGHTREVSSVSFSADNKRLLTSSFDRSVRIWDVATGKELKKFIGHTSRVECAAFVDGDRRVLFSGNENDPTLQLWDVESAKEIRRSPPVAGGFLGVAALPGGGRAVTAGRDGVIRFWRWKQ